MTPTSDERRMVAARLRKAVKEHLYSSSDLGESIAAEVNCYGYPREKVFTHLADLIEPEPERTCHVTMRDRYEVRGGQYIEDWDLSCGDHILIDGDMPDVGLRCPVCGARVVSGDAQ